MIDERDNRQNEGNYSQENGEKSVYRNVNCKLGLRWVFSLQGIIKLLSLTTLSQEMVSGGHYMLSLSLIVQIVVPPVEKKNGNFHKSPNKL